MKAMTYSFNLISEKWIPCRLLSSPFIELKSLEDVLLESHAIREIVGDAPPVTIALYRLLLAVVHRALGPLPMSSFGRDWETVWNAEAFDAKRIKNYLHDEMIYSRFDLFDEQYPFYQTVSIPEPISGKDSVAKLFFQMDSNKTVFNHSLVKDPPSLTAGSAACWLIAFQAFDVSGTRGTEKGQVTVSTAPLVQSAVGLARGKNLFETLMLNLYWDDKEFFRNFGQSGSKDKPAWERGMIVNAETREPTGYIDLLTWQSRRIRLRCERGGNGEQVVRHARVWDGQYLPANYERTGKETMVAFKKLLKPSKNDSAKQGKSESPIGIRQDKAVWRDSYALFHSTKGQNEKSLMLSWLNGLEALEVLPNASIVPIDFFCLTTDGKKPTSWRHERLPLPLSYLKDELLCDELRRALKVSESIAKVLVASVRRLTTLLLYLPDCHLENPTWFSPLLKQKAREEAEEQQKKIESKKKRELPQVIDKRVKTFAPEMRYWSRLEDEFRRVLVALARDFNLWAEQRERWAKVLERVALHAFNEIAIGLGQSTRTLRAVAIAEHWLKAEMGLRKKKYLASEEIEEENQEGGDEE